MEFKNDSESLRSTFYDSKNDIADGWSVIAEGDDGDYGHDLWMLLRGPDGKYHEQSASCSSCYGIEVCLWPVETNTSAIRAMIEQEKKYYGDEIGGCAVSGGELTETARSGPCEHGFYSDETAHECCARRPAGVDRHPRGIQRGSSSP